MKKLILLFFLFTVIISAQVLQTPSDNATGIARGVQSFDWDDYGSFENDGLTEDDYYRVKVGTSLGGSEFYYTPASTLALSTENIDLSTTAYNTLYYWTVEAWDDGVLEFTYTGFSFTTLIASPVLTYPLNLATGVSVLPNVTWTFAGGTTGVTFDVELSDDGGGTWSNVVTGLAGTSTNYTFVSSLNYNDNYVVRIRAHKGGEADKTSSENSFTTISATPSLVSPANNSIGLSLTGITLTWTAVTGATHYRVTVSPNPGASPYTVVAPAVTQTLPALTAGTYYTWYVESSNDGGTSWSTPSSTWNFMTNFLTSVANPSQGNYAVGISVLPTFTWAAAAGASGYNLELSTDGSTWTTYASVTSPHSFANFDQLLSGTLYYWRVRANDVGGAGVHRYSSTWEFTTHIGNLNFTTYYPSGTSVYLTWLLLPSTTGVKYDLYYSDDSFATTITVPNLTSAYNTVTGLDPATTYEFIVRAKNSAGTVIIAFSSTISVTTDGLPTAYLSYPIGGATTYSNPPYLYWYTGTTFTGQYRVRYSDDPTVDGNGMLSVGGANLALTSNLYTVFPAALTAGETYYWQVQCTDGSNDGDWSDVESFVVYSTTPTTPPVPYPSWLVGGYDSYINPPTLYWYTGTYTTGLEFYVLWDDISNFSNGNGGNSGWITNLYFTLPSSLSTGTWYWKVKSRIATTLAESAYSTTESFVIPTSTSTVSVPYPTYPVGTIISTLTPTLTWFAVTPPALQYRVRISPYSSTDVNGMLDHVTAVSSGWTGSTSMGVAAIPFTLVAGATYYWQVQSKLAAAPNTESSWSYVVSFETAAGASALVPFVVSPIQGQPINSTSAMLTWAVPSTPQSHLKYDVEYSKSPDFFNAVKLSNVNEPFVKIDGLNTNTKYYWRVSSKNYSGSVSMYSGTGSFSTSNTTDVEPEHQAIPDKYSLEQNYPNPFNPTTRISFSLPKADFVNVRVYDMLGREVKILMNEYRNGGTHSVNWNGEDNLGQKVASGTYIYRITTGSFSASKKMVLLK